jgi:hypothetical protein
VSPPVDEEYGYDIDELLAAQTFLFKGLLSLPELSSIVGVPLDWDDLAHSTLIRPWNPRNPSDMRVAVDDILAIQKRLTANWTPNYQPDKPKSLREMARLAERPFQVVSEAVVQACHGDLSPFAWAPPFDWGSIVLSELDSGNLRDSK